MEVSDEIKLILADKQNIKIVCEDLESQQKELNKKIYFFRVLDMIQQVGELIENKIFETNYIDYIKIFVSNQEDVGSKLYIKFYDREDEDIPSYVNKDINKLSSFFSNFNGLNIEDTGSDFDNRYGTATVKLNKKYKKKLIEVFFSDELQLVLEKTLSYVQLENELGKQVKDTSKKMKV